MIGCRGEQFAVHWRLHFLRRPDAPIRIKRFQFASEEHAVLSGSIDLIHQLSPRRAPQFLIALAAVLVIGPLRAGADDATPPDAKSTATADDRTAEKSPDRLFRELDADGDGTLTAAEVGDERRSWFDRLIRVGDRDKDGSLSRAEFVEGLQPRERRPAAGPDRPERGEGRGMGDPAERFARLDRNGDGKLTLEEVPEALRERIKPLFDRLGKTELTREEFLRASARPNPAEMQRNMDQFLTGMDRDGDGQITLAEAPKFIKPRFQELLEKAGRGENGALSFDEIRRAFGAAPTAARPGMDGRPGPLFLRKLDTDGDGRLSKEELQNAAKFFDELDADGDGLIDPRELFGPGRPGSPPDERPAAPSVTPASSRPAAPPSGDKPPAAGPPAAEAKPGRLARIDANGDGQVSREEAQGKLRRNFDRFDANQDGHLDRTELREALQKLRRAKERGELKA